MIGQVQLEAMQRLRLASFETFSEHYPVGIDGDLSTGTALWRLDQQRLSEFFMQLFHEDDGEDITEAWLESVGFENIEDTWTYWIDAASTIQIAANELVTLPCEIEVNDVTWPFEIHTRAEVRGLARECGCVLSPVSVGEDVSVVLAERLTALVCGQSQWSQATFGTDESLSPLGAIRHLKDEAGEIESAITNCQLSGACKPADYLVDDVVEEFADAFLLLLDASRRSGLTFLALVSAATEKHEVNKSRTWPATVEGQPTHHQNESET